MSEHFDEIKVVIGLTGLKAAGKGEFGLYLVKHGFSTLRVSDAVRVAAKQQGISDPTVQQLQDIGDRARKDSGDNGFWAQKVLELAVERGIHHLIVDGIRNPGEIATLERLMAQRFTLVGIVAPLEIRAQRFLSRQQAGDPKTMSDFLNVDDRDRGIGQPPDGQQVNACLSQVFAGNLFNNEGTLEEYHKWIEFLYHRLLFVDAECRYIDPFDNPDLK